MGNKSSKKIIADGQDYGQNTEGQGDSMTVKWLYLPNLPGPLENAHIGLCNTVEEEIAHLINFYDLKIENVADCKLVVYQDENLTVLERTSRMENYRNILQSNSSILKLIYKLTLTNLNVKMH